jgi:hypothetical protein
LPFPDLNILGKQLSWSAYGAVEDKMQVTAIQILSTFDIIIEGNSAQLQVARQQFNDYLHCHLQTSYKVLSASHPEYSSYGNKYGQGCKFISTCFTVPGVV